MFTLKNKRSVYTEAFYAEVRVFPRVYDYYYMDAFGGIALGGVDFVRSFLGLIIRPYETYRRIVDHGRMWELLYVAVALAVYFGIASAVKASIFRPFLLTQHFLLLCGAVGLSYCVALLLFWYVGRSIGGKGVFGQFALAWGYTLLPTLFWFLMTSLLYVLLPPPRTNSPQGIAFSLLFLVSSAVLLFWKAQLVYLSLRFGMKMDLGKIALTSLIVVPLLGVYSIVMYQMGIFRVPFL